jgi:hypothetical protein
VIAAAVVLGLSGLVGIARADDKKKNDATGTWTWEAPGQGGQTRKVTLKLKVEGDKLTGSMPGRNNQETKIEDGTFKDGAVSFKITRERNGNKTTTTYTGKVEGDVLKMKAETERDGQKQSRDIEAKRSGD